MRFAIWSGAGTGIGMPSSMEKARHILSVQEGWRTALRKLPNAPGGTVALELISQLEINCHGGPGEIRLPDRSAKGLVNNTNVEEFGAMLRPSLASGALIELLACQVANTFTYVLAPEVILPDGKKVYPPTGVDTSKATPTTYSPSVIEEYWGAYEKDMIRPGPEEGGSRELDEAEVKTQLAYMPFRKQYEWDLQYNGLRFCLRLAAASGGIVRAGDFSQKERSRFSRGYSTDVFGNWEGHVWDFYPDGRVKYLGINLPRTQGKITFNGGLQNLNGRTMGGITEESPLRGQRLNRTPMPV